MVSLERDTCRFTKNIRSAIPIMMPGRRIGSCASVRKISFPKNCFLTMKKAPDVPSAIAIRTDIIPISNDLKTDFKDMTIWRSGFLYRGRISQKRKSKP